MCYIQAVLSSTFLADFNNLTLQRNVKILSYKRRVVHFYIQNVIKLNIYITFLHFLTTGYKIHESEPCHYFRVFWQRYEVQS